MSKVTTPKYRLVMPKVTSMAWEVRNNFQVKGKGKPTAANLEKFVMAYAKSLEAGGCNEHVSKALGFVPYPAWARIEMNDRADYLPTDQQHVVAEWKAGMFQVYA